MAIISGIRINSDNMGMLSSTICLIHCLATPFVFLAKTCAETCCSETPIWWRLIDFIFLVVSLVAIIYTAKGFVKHWIKIGLFLSWAFLCLIILNESLQMIQVDKWVIYVPAFLLIALHFYNRRSCPTGCCQTKEEINE